MADGSTKAGGASAIRPAPLSPHVQVWRWHVTMAASIQTRGTGVALYVGLLIIAWGALALANGQDAYGTFVSIMSSWLGRIVLFGITVSIFYHLAAGLRHLAWDTGKGFQPKTANLTAVAAMAFGIAAALVVWFIAMITGGA